MERGHTIRIGARAADDAAGAIMEANILRVARRWREPDQECEREARVRHEGANPPWFCISANHQQGRPRGPDPPPAMWVGLWVRTKQSEIF